MSLPGLLCALLGLLCAPPAGAQATLTSQNFDGVAASSLPAGWTAVASSSISISASTAAHYSGANSLADNTLNVNAVPGTYWATLDGNGGDVTLTALVYINDSAATGQQDALLFARATTNPGAYGSDTAYYADLEIDGSTPGLNLMKHVGGVQTAVTSKIGATAFARGTWYKLVLTLSGSTQTLSCQRPHFLADGTTVNGVGDGQWLTSAGAWQASQTTCAAGTDGSITGQGYAGAVFYDSNTATGGVVAVDDFVLTGNAAAASMTASPTSLTAGTPMAVTVTGTNTAWTSGTTFSVSGGTGAGVSGTSVNVGAQTATFTLNPGSAAATLTLQDSTDAATAAETVLAAPTPLYASVAFSRPLATPVLALGQTYGGVTADALAAPTVCRDAAGSRWVLQTDAWNVATSKWYNLTFTSPDLIAWTYVAGSLLSPTTGNYIIGNGGLLKIGSTFYRVYNAYAGNATPAGVYEQSSTDLVTWTAVNGGSPVLTASPDMSQAADPSLCRNPNTGLYELWYCGRSAGSYAMYATSPDGVTWTKAGAQFAAPAWAANFGEPQAFYVGADRYVTFDGGIVNGQRNVSVAVQKNSAGAYKLTFGVLNPEPADTWETTNVFDGCCVGLTDRGDGRGSQLWMLYAGSPITASTDATQSGLGLAYAPPPSATVTPPRGRLGAQN